MCNSAIFTKTVNNFTLEIFYDSDAESPLEWSSTKVAYNSRSRYVLGNLALDSEALETFEDRNDKVYALPVYAYIHSGVRLSTTSFSCSWDSGQSGWIFVAKDSPDISHLAGDREKVNAYLTSELEDFSSWLEGNNYYFTIKNSEGDVVESLGMGTWDDFDALVAECLETLNIVANAVSA
jgi:hypothetical protein